MAPKGNNSNLLQITTQNDELLHLPESNNNNKNTLNASQCCNTNSTCYNPINGKETTTPSGSSRCVTWQEVPVSTKKSRNGMMFLTSWLSLSKTLHGRDKMTMLLQYICRWIVWYFKQHRPLLSSIVKQIQSSLVDGRKAFRIGRSVTELQTLGKLKIMQLLEATISRLYQQMNSNSIMSPRVKSGGVVAHQITSTTTNAAIVAVEWKKWIRVFRHVAMTGFWATDNFVFFMGCIGSLKKKKKASRIANRLSFVASIAALWLAYDAYQQDCKRRRKEEEMQHHHHRRHQYSGSDMEKSSTMRTTLIWALVKVRIYFDRLFNFHFSHFVNSPELL